jgi:hypothetical protein
MYDLDPQDQVAFHGHLLSLVLCMLTSGLFKIKMAKYKSIVNISVFIVELGCGAKKVDQEDFERAENCTGICCKNSWHDLDFKLLHFQTKDFIS